MARFNLDDYIDVAERIQQFYERYPNGRITTELLNTANWEGKQTQFIVKSYMYDGDTLLATGLAEESFGNSGPNQTSALENAETSSIGRCAANLNFSTTRSGARQRPSRQEMEKVQRGTEPAEPTPLDNMKRMLGDTYTEANDRKAFVERVIGREIASYNDITEAEITAVMLELS
jgi:hypothetical protein